MSSKPCPFCGALHSHYPSCDIMRHIPKPWGGEEWQKILAGRGLNPVAQVWRCVTSDGVEHVVQCEGETISAVAARLRVWPLVQHKPESA